MDVVFVVVVGRIKEPPPQPQPTRSTTAVVEEEEAKQSVYRKESCVSVCIGKCGVITL